MNLKVFQTRAWPSAVEVLVIETWGDSDPQRKRVPFLLLVVPAETSRRETSFQSYSVPSGITVAGHEQDTEYWTTFFKEQAASTIQRWVYDEWEERDRSGPAPRVVLREVPHVRLLSLRYRGEGELACRLLAEEAWDPEVRRLAEQLLYVKPIRPKPEVG